MTTGERIRGRRLELPQFRKSQKALADAIGVRRETVNQWETDARVPEGENLLKLARALDVTPEWILQDQGSRTHSVVRDGGGGFYGGEGVDLRDVLPIPPEGDPARPGETARKVIDIVEHLDGLRRQNGTPTDRAKAARGMEDSIIRDARRSRVWTELDERVWDAYKTGLGRDATDEE